VKRLPLIIPSLFLASSLFGHHLNKDAPLMPGAEAFKEEPSKGKARGAVLLLHGFGSSPADLRELGSRLAEAGYAVSCPLLPGHGTSPEDLSHFRWPHWYAAAEAEYRLLRKDHGKVFVVGFSMGGTLAVHLAQRNELDGMVLLAPMLGVRHKWYYILPAEWWANSAGRIMRYASWEGRDISLMDKSQAKRIVAYSRFPMNAVRSVLRFVRIVKKRADEISEPVLALHGEEDDVTSPGKVRRFMGRLGSRERRFVILERSNHFLTFDFDRERVFRETLSFLGRFSADEPEGG